MESNVLVPSPVQMVPQLLLNQDLAAQTNLYVPPCVPFVPIAVGFVPVSVRMVQSHQLLQASAVQTLISVPRTAVRTTVSAMLVQLNPSALYQKMDAALSVYHLHVLQTAAVYSVLSAVQDQRGVEMGR